MKTKIPFILAAIITSTGAFADDDGVAQSSNGPSVAPATVLTGTCPATKTSFVTDDTIGASTASSLFSPVPSMTKVINITGNTVRPCIAINYSATVFANANSTALMFVQATLDGNVCAPGPVQFDGDSDEDGDGRWARAHAFNFVCQNVTPGLHTVQMQYRSNVNGEAVFTHWRSMVIHH